MASHTLIFGIFSMLLVAQARADGIEENVTNNETPPVYRVTTVLNDPWMIKTEAGYEGVLADILEEIAALANFTYTIKETPSSTYGRIKYVGEQIQVNGIIGEILSGEADLGVADLIISDLRSNMVSFSKPFATTGVQILLRKPDNNARGLGVIFIPFSAPLWICSIAALLITTSVIFCFERFRMSKQETKRGINSKRLNLVGSFHFIMSSTLCQGSQDKPVPCTVRLLMLSWRLFVIINLISYTASFTGYLLSTSNSKPAIPFKTFEEMAGQSDVRYGGWFGMVLNMNDNVQRAMNRHINSKHTQYSNMEDAIQRVLDKNNEFAAVVDGFSGQKAVNKNCELMLLQEQLFEIDFGMACAPNLAGEALCLKMSRAITALSEDGILFRIMNKWWEKSRKCEKMSENDFITSSRDGTFRFQPLDIKDMFVAYVILLIGITASVTITVVGRTCRKKKACNKSDNSAVNQSELNSNHVQRTANSVPDLAPGCQYKDELSLEGSTEDYPDIDAP